ncbi:hypothetical protein BC834DRAFT_837151, partial [Gloeopeniophorella convolvens]
IMSVLMQSTNQKCNSMASLIGLFCHSTSTPELVVEMLAHTGLSISSTAVHNIVNSLSKDAHMQLRKLASTRLASFVYDNFDMDFKSWSHTADKPGSTLIHATSAFAFPLQHGVTPDDLKHVEVLWSNSPLNPSIPDSAKRAPRSWLDAMDAKYSARGPRATVPNTIPPPNVSNPAQGLAVGKHTLAWHFRSALVNHCPGFEHFRNVLGSPDEVMQIPVVKTPTVPCRAMDIDQSTNDGQADIIENLFEQANIGAPEDSPKALDITEHVILFHGDLGTGERFHSICHEH